MLAIRGDQHSPDFNFAAGNAYLNKVVSEPAQAVQVWLPRVIQSWERCLEIGDQPELEGSMRGRGSFWLDRNLLMIYGQLGDPEKNRTSEIQSESLCSGGNCLEPTSAQKDAFGPTIRFSVIMLDKSGFAD